MINGTAAGDPELAGLLERAFEGQTSGGRWAVAAVANCRDRRATWHHGATAASAFELASVTKTFTALLLAVLTVQQRVALDDLLASYLPAAAGALTTLVDLATHSAGYPRLPRAIIRYGLSADPYARLTDRQIDREVRRLARRRAGEHPVSYSNLGFGVLSRALAAAGGRPFGELLRAEVLDPLGLGITLDTDPGTGRLTGHRHAGRTTVPWHNPALAGAGCLWASIDQLGDFLAAHIRSSALQQAIDLVVQPRKPMSSPPGHICLSWMLRQLDWGNVHWHNGSTYGFGSFAAFDRSHHVAVGALINRERPPGLDSAAIEVLRIMSAYPR